jgi:PAS domain S-box-containing protein
MSDNDHPHVTDQEIEDLRARLREAEETIQAIREGHVDALIVSDSEGQDRLYTLQGAEQVYRLLVEAMNEGALVLTADGCIAYCNNTFAALLYVPLEKVVGTSIYDYLHADSVAQVRGLLSEAMNRAGKAEVSLRGYGITKDIPAFVSVGSLPLDESDLLTAVVTDLTHHKRTEAELGKYREHLEELVEQRTRELVESNRKIANILESIGDAFVAFDKEWRYTYINGLGESFLYAHCGLRRDELIGRVVWDIFPEMIGTFRYQEYHRAVLEQTPVKLEYYDEITSKWYQLSAYPAADGLSLYFEDITDRVLFERYKDGLLDRERHIAEVLQGTVVPYNIPDDLPGCHVAVNYRPALHEAEVGGDFYDLFDLGNGRVGIVIGDVVGKGLNAAVRVTAARYTIRSYARLFDSPAEVLAQANAALIASGDEANMLTISYSVLDTGSGALVTANAGHEPMVAMSPNGECSELFVPGILLGIEENASYDESCHMLDVRDKLVLITDGVTEARSSEVGLFGKDAMMDYLRNHATDGPEAITTGLLEAAADHAGGNLQDDAALVVVEWIGRPAGKQLQTT